MNELTKIKRMASEYDNSDNVIKRRGELQERLKTLCDKYGTARVIAATNYTAGTLDQYLRSKTPPSISEVTVFKAENILSNI